jgi:hypothetical protein
MKLIIAGATGFVATECLRQALIDARFTSLIALARREVKPPTDLGPKADIAKLQSVVLQDYGTYPEEVKKQLAGADACIWTVAITPGKARMYEWEEVKRVCRDNALVGFQTIIDARGDKHGDMPLRFIYMSGTSAERDQTKSPLLLKEMFLMRVCLPSSFAAIPPILTYPRAKQKRQSSNSQLSTKAQWKRAVQNQVSFFEMTTSW